MWDRWVTIKYFIPRCSYTEVNSNHTTVMAQCVSATFEAGRDENTEAAYANISGHIHPCNGSPLLQHAKEKKGIKCFITIFCSLTVIGSTQCYFYDFNALLAHSTAIFYNVYQKKIGAFTLVLEYCYSLYLIY